MSVINPEVKRVRILLLEKYGKGPKVQPRHKHGHRSAERDHEGGDENGRETLKYVCANRPGRKSKGPATSAEVQELEKEIATVALEKWPDLTPLDIVVVGNHPFSVRPFRSPEPRLFGHKTAERWATVRLNWQHRDVVVWESPHRFTIRFKPQDQKKPTKPFTAGDTFEAGKINHGGWAAISGPPWPGAHGHRHYKGTIEIAGRTVDPDLIIMP
jgi:hypothetical protein